MMRKLLAVSLFVNAVLLVGRFGEHSPVKAQGGGAGLVASRNGDADGRDDITINDPIYLLNWLFLGGPEPVPCPVTVGPSGLPDTGQTQCYDSSGAVIDCTGATCPGQDGFYQTGCPSEGRFVDNQDGTVTDTCTGLMWQKDTADVNGDGQLTNGDSRPWCDALAYCENLSFAGHDDWRLPNVRELQSIVDYGRINPAIDPVFGALGLGFYWSSTSLAFQPVHAWRVDSFYGIVYVGGECDSKDSFYFVRAVRTGP